jgi:hypothetical protein
MPPKATVTLKGQRWHFVEDAELRHILARDYAELKKLLDVGAHKSAIVLSGSIMEALLVNALRRDQAAAQHQYKLAFPRRDERPLDRWELHELIAVAAGLDIVGDNLKAEAAVVQDYRNLIHPMAEQRKNAVIDAHAVNAVVSLLARILAALADDSRHGTEAERFLLRLKRTRGESEAQVARDIMAWAEQQGLQAHWTKALNYLPRLNFRGDWVAPITVRPTGHLNVRFGFLKKTRTALRHHAQRQELADRLNAIPGVRIRPQDRAKFPAIKLKLLLGDAPRSQFLSCMTWVVDTIRQPAPD